MGARPTVALIDMGALKHNYGEIRKRLSPKTGIMAVVKANAYGHGDVEVSRALEGFGCESFAVAFTEEGINLRKGGIKSPILILGGVDKTQAEEAFSYELTPVVHDIAMARLLDGCARKTGRTKPVHVEIDSGMGRMGVLTEGVTAFFEEFKKLEGILLEGVLSHFSEADREGGEFSDRQLEVFLGALGKIRAMGYNPPYIHMANSAALLEKEESRFNIVRPGIMLYGAYPAPHLRNKIELLPVMQVKTRILQLKRVPAGFPVSYGRTFVTGRESTIATIPIGYGDGLPRRLSEKGEVIVRGRRAPMAGVICMDHTMIDCTNVEGVDVGDEVVIMGRQGSIDVLAEEIAEKTGTIPYEILCNISSRVRRVYA
ncbi:MAG: alanine racemase [Deltaproteobacteria bacterium]|nr:alanine racemase [Deltaproteobacteria bacterium]